MSEMSEGISNSVLPSADPHTVWLALQRGFLRVLRLICPFALPSAAWSLVQRMGDAMRGDVTFWHRSRVDKAWDTRTQRLIGSS